jgi:hypothetical protein
MKKGDKIICKRTIKNLLGDPLFKKGHEYEVLYINNEDIITKVVLNHIMYANEYNEFDLEWVLKNFIISK